MLRVFRRHFLEALGSAGALALAGCSADGDDDPTSAPIRTATTAATTATPTATATPRAPADEPIGSAAMLDRTPAHPEMPDASYVWARYLDAAGLLADVDDDTIDTRLRDGWLGSGPPAYADSNAFELVHVQPGELSNVTLGRGDYDAATAVEGMVADGWRRLGGDTEGYTFLDRGGYAAAVGERFWIVVSTDDDAVIEALVAAIADDPLTTRFDGVDHDARARASEEPGNYLVVQRSVRGDYAAGIALDYAPYHYPAGVLHYATGRESPSWQRVERQFRTRIVGELRAVDFGDDFG